MVFVKTFVIFVPFVFQFADPATTVDEPKAMSALKRRGALCASVVNRHLWGESAARLPPLVGGEGSHL